ncbi:MAG: ABC transporter permease [Spirochaetaceae bacterium]|jgi:peptide/nickel transport system permease protein|nr:ABC transporter permease [Spirochaetaceae bacterium]
MKHFLQEVQLYLRGNILVSASLCTVGMLILIAVAAPLIAPYPEDSELALHLENKLAAPSFSHPFGTDEMGRDLFSRVIYGTRLSLLLALVIIIISVSTGSAYGLISGYAGGRIDAIMMRICEVFLSFPSLLLSIAIAAILGPSLSNTTFSIALAWWPWFARIVRNETLIIRERGFIEAARTMNVSGSVILVRHVLRNALPVIISQASISFGSIILSAASLSFLGLGVQPPAPEWGLLISTGKSYFLNSWWYVTFPGIFIFITVVAFSFIGDGFRDFFDPKVRD